MSKEGRKGGAGKEGKGGGEEEKIEEEFSKNKFQKMKKFKCLTFGKIPQLLE